MFTPKKHDPCNETQLICEKRLCRFTFSASLFSLFMKTFYVVVLFTEESVDCLHHSLPANGVIIYIYVGRELQGLIIHCRHFLKCQHFCNPVYL